MIDVCALILDFNRKREAERLAMKYHNMSTTPFVFLRATCHLFYARLAAAPKLPAAPLTWCMGDLHLENFGSYKADSRLAYFDLNDFDEAVLAPLNWDLLRLLTSIQVAADSMGVSAPEARELAQEFLLHYRQVLSQGKAYWIERETAQGLVRNLLSELKFRQRSDFLDRRSYFENGQRRLRIDGKKALAVSAKQAAKVTRFLKAFARTQSDKKFFKPLDIARRVAGNGSLGVERYIILVHGKGGTNGNYLLDLKQALPSSLIPFLDTPQPQWKSEAERVVTIQKRMQAMSMAFLQDVEVDGQSYLLRALQAAEDRINLDSSASSYADLKQAIGMMGVVVASAQLRSAGRSGSANADALVAHGADPSWSKPLLKRSRDCAKQVQEDWKTYCKAYNQGDFSLPS